MNCPTCSLPAQVVGDAILCCNCGELDSGLSDYRKDRQDQSNRLTIKYILNLVLSIALITLISLVLIPLVFPRADASTGWFLGSVAFAVLLGGMMCIALYVERKFPDIYKRSY